MEIPSLEVVLDLSFRLFQGCLCASLTLGGVLGVSLEGVFPPSCPFSTCQSTSRLSLDLDSMAPNCKPVGEWPDVDHCCCCCCSCIGCKVPVAPVVLGPCLFIVVCVLYWVLDILFSLDNLRKFKKCNLLSHVRT